jgi:hypothetical protein
MKEVRVGHAEIWGKNIPGKALPFRKDRDPMTAQVCEGVEKYEEGWVVNELIGSVTTGF